MVYPPVIPRHSVSNDTRNSKYQNTSPCWWDSPLTYPPVCVTQCEWGVAGGVYTYSLPYPSGVGGSPVGAGGRGRYDRLLRGYGVGVRHVRNSLNTARDPYAADRGWAVRAAPWWHCGGPGYSGMGILRGRARGSSGSPPGSRGIADNGYAKYPGPASRSPRMPLESTQATVDCRGGIGGDRSAQATLVRFPPTLPNPRLATPNSRRPRGRKRYTDTCPTVTASDCKSRANRRYNDSRAGV